MTHSPAPERIDDTCVTCRFALIGVKKDLFFTPDSGEHKKRSEDDQKHVRVQCRRFPTYEYHKLDEWCGEHKLTTE